MKTHRINLIVPLKIEVDNDASAAFVRGLIREARKEIYYCVGGVGEHGGYKVESGKPGVQE